MYSQILYCVLEEFGSSLNQTMNGRPNCSGVRTQSSTENWIESKEPMDFEWMFYPGFTTLLILLEIQKIND